MLLENDLIRYVESGRQVRVLWLHTEKNTVFLIDVLDEIAIPFELSQQTLIEDLMSKRAVTVDDPFQQLTLEDKIKASYRAIRDKAMRIIQPIVIQKPAVFYSNKRWRLINDAIRLNQCNHKTIYRYLRKFWQKGQHPNALLPDYSNSGGKGKVREIGIIKRGRPRKYIQSVGINVSEDMRKTFLVAVSRYYVTNKRFTLKNCYKKMLKEFFCKKSIDPYSGRVTLFPIEGEDDSHFPTFAQFQYWVDKDNNRLDMKRKRLGSRVYDKDMRGLISTSNSEVWGPGARFQIDATIADVYLLSRIDRRKIIGRPVIYVVIDVYSRMIVGLYIGLENPSWVAAMMALGNTVEDKQAFCKKYGVEIEPEDWPCHHLPAAVLGDRGEIASGLIDNLINNFFVEIESSAPFRADWKGIVEQRFALLPAVFKPYVDGYIQTDYQERGATDYRLDATLDIDQFTAITIESVLYFNNAHEIKNYDKDHDLAAADFAAVPIQLWEWGISNKSGSLRNYPADRVKFSLMPSSEATITEFGIKLRSTYYTCQRAMQEGWFDKARQDGRTKVQVSYEPRDMDFIYIHAPDKVEGYEVCQLTPRSRAYVNSTSWEIEQAEHSSKVRSAEHAPKERMASLNLIANIEAVVESAKDMKPPSMGVSATSRTKDIRQNRLIEKSDNRKTEVIRLGDAAKPVPRNIPNNIVRFPAGQDDDYDEPDITQIIKSGKEDA